MDKLEGDQLGVRIAAETGLQAPHLNVDPPFAFASPHGPPGRPPGDAFEPTDWFGTEEPRFTVQDERDRLSVRSGLHSEGLRHPTSLRKPDPSHPERTPSRFRHPRPAPDAPDWLFDGKGNPSAADVYGPFPVSVDHIRDFRTAWVLSLTLGWLGVDRFYLRRPYTGALKLLTFGGLGLWWLADVFAILSGHATNGGGHPMRGDWIHRVWAWWASASLVVVILAAAMGLGAGHFMKKAADTVIRDWRVAVEHYAPAGPP